MTKRLTFKRCEVLEFLAEHERKSPRTYTGHARMSDMRALGEMGYAECWDVNQFGWRITPAGAAAIGRANLFAETAQREPEAPLLLANRTDYGWSVKALDSTKSEDLTDPDVLIDELVNTKPLAVISLAIPRDAEIAELRADVAALKADRQRVLERVVALENLVERFKTMYDLINRDDIRNNILNALFDPNNETALEQWGEWRCLMDSDVGLMAQYNRVGMYAPDEKAEFEQ